MNKWIASIGCLAFMVLGCNQNQPTESENWNTIRSGWQGTATYNAHSKQAKDAVDTYTDYQGTNTAYMVDHFQVVLHNVTNNADGTQTWTYAITKIGDGPTAQDLSHFDIISNCSSSNFTQLHGGAYGPDPAGASCTGGVDVVKWNVGVSAGQTVYYSMTTDHQYAVGTATGVVKYGTSCGSGSLPGPDCSQLADDGGSGTGGGTGGGTEPPASGNDCPAWLDSLQLGVSVTYKNYHGYNNLGFPVYYLGETMEADLSITNTTGHTADNIKVRTIVTNYPGSTLACGNPVQEWTGITILPGDTLTLNHSYYLTNSCAWGNYESHAIISRESDSDCPLAVMIVNRGVGIFDP